MLKIKKNDWNLISENLYPETTNGYSDEVLCFAYDDNEDENCFIFLRYMQGEKKNGWVARTDDCHFVAPMISVIAWTPPPTLPDFPFDGEQWIKDFRP